MANDVVYIGARVPIVDPDTGLITQDWFRYFNQIGVKAAVVDGNVALSATTGAASALPALPAGYMIIKIKGGTYKVPYYN